MAAFFTAAVSRNNPKESINLAWMFTSGITGLVHIDNRELMHLSDQDRTGLEEQLARAVQLCTSQTLCPLCILCVEIFKELLPLPVVCTPTFPPSYALLSSLRNVITLR